MSTFLLEINQALASYAARHQGRTVAMYMSERKLTQLILDVSRLGAPARFSTNAGRRTYRSLELLRDEMTWTHYA